MECKSTNYAQGVLAGRKFFLSLQVIVAMNKTFGLVSKKVNAWENKEFWFMIIATLLPIG